MAKGLLFHSIYLRTFSIDLHIRDVFVVPGQRLPDAGKPAFGVLLL